MLYFVVQKLIQEKYCELPTSSRILISRVNYYWQTQELLLWVLVIILLRTKCMNNPLIQECSLDKIFLWNLYCYCLTTLEKAEEKISQIQSNPVEAPTVFSWLRVEIISLYFMFIGFSWMWITKLVWFVLTNEDLERELLSNHFYICRFTLKLCGL